MEKKLNILGTPGSFKMEKNFNDIPANEKTVGYTFMISKKTEDDIASVAIEVNYAIQHKGKVVLSLSCVAKTQADWQLSVNDVYLIAQGAIKNAEVQYDYYRKKESLNMNFVPMPLDKFHLQVVGLRARLN